METLRVDRGQDTSDLVALVLYIYLRLWFAGPMATGRIELGVEDRKVLEGWSRAQRVEHRLKIRSQIILKAAEGYSGREIGKSLSIPR